MKVQYLGDVNDYRKYALLRLLAETGLRIGVHWMLTAADERGDGKKRSYLAQANVWRSYDPNLFALLTDIPLAPTFEDFRRIEQEGTIPGAVYLDEMVPVGGKARAAFHTNGMDVFAACDLVFFDPDNGLAARSASKNTKQSVKFVFDDELADHYNAGRSLLLYQHFPHVEHLAFIKALSARLRTVAPDAAVWACHTPNVVFMLAASRNANATHIDRITAAIDTGSDRWSNAFIRFERVRSSAPVDASALTLPDTG